MDKYMWRFFIVLLLTGSCKQQNSTKPPKKHINLDENIPNKNKIPVADPYFIESKTITSPDGPKSITRNILEDKKGNIWLATWEGILRYDGKEFTNLTKKEALLPFHVFALLEDKKGNIWFGTIGAGVYLYDGTKFISFTTEQGLANNNITCIYEDKTGNIWFGTLGGVSRYNGKTFRNITTKDGLNDNEVNAIIEDETGRLWFGTRSEACIYNDGKFTKITNEEGMPFINIRSIIEAKDGNFWLGGNDGLWRYDGASFVNYAKNFVGYIYEDKKGAIWTSAAVADAPQDWVLSKYDEKGNATAIKTEGNMFFGIEEDKDGGIWLGNLNGVYRYDGKSFNDFGALSDSGFGN